MEKNQPNLKRESFTSWTEAVKLVWDDSECSGNPQPNHTRGSFTSWTEKRESLTPWAETVTFVRCTMDKGAARHGRSWG